MTTQGGQGRNPLPPPTRDVRKSIHFGGQKMGVSICRPCDHLTRLLQDFRQEGRCNSHECLCAARAIALAYFKFSKVLHFIVKSGKSITLSNLYPSTSKTTTSDLVFISLTYPGPGMTPQNSPLYKEAAVTVLEGRSLAGIKKRHLPVVNSVVHQPP
ncbi:hypothetical protein E2C01_065172 [Portunus trituberculatus]|uniref:Uncharacterized protein n=1 Tax=Portunus trituberculatus TaxID=210409 RepID=A0A5B7HEY7_PORTR|nr:hypothetical protein [Portunus trituberculatus]